MCYFSEIRCKGSKFQLIMQEFINKYSTNFNKQPLCLQHPVVVAVRAGHLVLANSGKGFQQ